MVAVPHGSSYAPTRARPSDRSAELERPWLAKYPACVNADVVFEDAPAWALLQSAADELPERTACHYYRQTRTYEEWWDDALRAATVLRVAGVQPGDRVGLLLPNCPEYLSMLHGIWLAGGVAVALSPLMVTGEVSSLLEATDCRVVVALDMLAPLVRGAERQPEKVFYTTLCDRLPHWQRLPYMLARCVKLGPTSPIGQPGEEWLDLSKAQPAEDLAPVTGDDPAYILPTGGTTGHPKAVTLTHANLLANARQLESWCGSRHGRDAVLAILPFFHAYGLSTCGLSAIASAATIVMHHRFVPKIVHRLLETYEPTIFPAVPRVLSAMNEYFRTKPIRRWCVQYVVSGGASLDRSIAEEFESHTGARVVEGYGLSEASPVTHTGPLDDTARDGSIGLPLPGTDTRIVDPETGTRTLSPGEVGELLVRGPQVMAGYWQNPEATEAVLHDGWLHTGDLATMDEDGFFRIVDRIKDIVIVNGFNVHPSDVESVFREQEAVADCAVVGVPDERTGEAVRAYVVLRPGAAATTDALHAFSRERLSKHKRPSTIEIVDDLPRNFLGKVLRRELREAAQSEGGTR